MNIKYIKQIEKEEFEDLTFDLIIASSGYEARATAIASKLNNKAENKIVFSFDDHSSHPVRTKNDSIFEQLGYKSITAKGDNSEQIIVEIDSYIRMITKKELSVLIDYSSMTRVWYGAIVNYLRYLDVANKLVKVYYAYSCAEIHKPVEKESNIAHFIPIKEYCRLSVPFVPTALVTGLGYESNHAYGLKEYFDAELVYLFYTDRNEFTKYVKDTNKDLLDETSSEFIIPYEVNDVLLTKTILYDLCSTLQNNFRVIIAPCGPKIFTLISFLVASEFETIDVWRISSNNLETHENRESTGKIITCEVCYQQG